MSRWNTIRTLLVQAVASTLMTPFVPLNALVKVEEQTRTISNKSLLKQLLISALATGLALPVVAAAQSAAPAVVSQRASYGTIVGIVTDSAKRPLAHATVTAVRVDGSGIRATVSGSDGVYSFADLPPGAWSVTSQIDGYPEVTAPQLEVLASKATRLDIVMNVPAAAPAVAAAPTVAAATPAVPTVALGLQEPEAGPEVDNQTPFAYADFTWMNATPRNKAPAFDTKFFTPDIRLDVNYMYDNNHPQDHTIVGATESFRSGEFQVEQISFGGDFHWENVRGRILTMYGLFGTTTPRNDASSGNIGGVGQWDLQDAYKYVSEANAGYHWDVNHGLNVDAGI
ncbi:MAG: TonB-dependent receptor, partial [Steroidobacteraceae bacterium]